ncbi:MAG: DUF423 domain-containing protein [Deltaproteobacteria bacterium]|nr:DUF423 domain-containing protein [Deltaproteobacteria bacterium]
MGTRIVATGAVLVGIGVALGAFGAHGLKARLAPDLLEIYHTGVEYQLCHGLGIVLLGLFVSQHAAAGAPAGTSLAFWSFLAGVVLFSGSLYVLSLTGVRWLGAITPLGGLAFLVGWASFAWAALQR